jgi:hypothetical protein
MQHAEDMVSKSEGIQDTEQWQTFVITVMNFWVL